MMLEDKKASVLVVDDEDQVRCLLASFLSEEYICVTAPTVKEAMTFLSNVSFDVVVTDIGMPDTSGFNLCDFIQRIQPEAVIIVISGDLDKDKVWLHGAFDCIEKPFDVVKVQMAVRRAISYRRLRQRLA